MEGGDQSCPLVGEGLRGSVQINPVSWDDIHEMTVLFEKPDEVCVVFEKYLLSSRCHLCCRRVAVSIFRIKDREALWGARIPSSFGLFWLLVHPPCLSVKLEVRRRPPLPACLLLLILHGAGRRSQSAAPCVAQVVLASWALLHVTLRTRRCCKNGEAAIFRYFKTGFLLVTQRL